MQPADDPSSITNETSDTPSGPPPAPDEAPAPRSRIRRAFSRSRELWRVVYRDPEHVAERLTLYSADRLGEPSREWAQSVRRSQPDTPPAKIAEELRTQSAHVARIDGAVSGTPFFVALVPGYLTYLFQEMRMTLRTAALYDRDPRDLRTSAQMLALRGVHPDVETAEAALRTVRDKGLPERPATSAIVAHLGSQRLPAAHLRRLHVSIGRQRRHGNARQGQGRIRRPDRRRNLGDDLGASPHLHDHDGLGM